MKKLTVLSIVIISLISILFSTTSSASSLAGAWDFEDQGVGGITADISGADPALDGTLQSAEIVPSGDPNHGYVLNPNGGGVLLGYDSKLYSPKSLTVQYWHKKQNPSEQWKYVVGQGGGGPRHFNMNGGMLFAVQTSDSGWNPLNIWRPDWPDPQVWHHVVATYDGNDLYGYIDGVLVGQVYRGGTLNSQGSQPWSIGCQYDNDTGFILSSACSDLIDDVAIWTGYATQDVVQGLYEGTYNVHNAPIFVPGYLGSFPVGDFDENGYVNEDDLDILAAKWLEDCTMADCCNTDIYDDNEIDFADYALFAGNWQYDEGTGKLITIEDLNGIPTFKVDSNFTTAAGFSHNWPHPDIVPVDGFEQNGTIFQDFGGYSTGSSWLSTNPDRWDYSTVDTRIEFIISRAPDTLIMPAWMSINAPDWWLADPANQDELEMVDSGSGLSYYYTTLSESGPYPSLASEKWRQDMKYSLENFLDYLYLTGQMEHIAGFKLGDVGCGGENLHRAAHTGELAGYGLRTQQAFKDWLREKYNDDVNALRTSWNNVSVTFETASVPSYTERKAYSGTRTFRDPSVYMNVIDFELFWNDLVVDTMDYFAGVIKKKTNGTKLVGGFYCYMYEWCGNPEDGHQALRKFNESENLDFVWQTASYETRGYIGGADVLRGPSYSNILNGKPWANNNDLATLLATELDSSDRIRLGYTDTVERNKRMFLRSAGFNICNVGLLQEFFALHDHWYDDPALVDAAGQVNQIYIDSINHDRSSASEVLVVTDEVSCSYTTYSQWDHPLTKSAIRTPQLALTQMGIPNDQILLDDISLLPDPSQYKVVIFLNCWNMNDAQRVLVDSLKGNSRVLVFCYAEGYFNDTSGSVANMQDVCGMTMAEGSESFIAPRVYVKTDHPLGQAFSNKGVSLFGQSSYICKRYNVNDASADRLGSSSYVGGYDYMAIKDMGSWESIWTITAEMPADVLREIARYAGAHIYNESNDTFYANRSYVCIHPDHDENTLQSRTISFPFAVDLYDAETGSLLDSNITSYTTDYYGGDTKMYRYESAQ